jgi:UDP-N-acetylglucosamine 2-epimerase (non-hydrolysing)
VSRILTVLGTRPEIIKLSPLIPVLAQRHDHVIVHSGQHYSFEMDATFFSELSLPTPDYTLAVGSGSHGEQTARMLTRLEPILLERRPDAVLVQGDTNTTMAGALCAAKLGMRVIHLEAGGRSFNRRMPEELNRIVVDHIATLLLAADDLAFSNLRAEGLGPELIRLVGSTAIDAVERNKVLAGASTILERVGLVPGEYVALTFHRAENTTAEVLPGVLDAVGDIARRVPVVFPVHPRTVAAMNALGLGIPPGVVALDPLGYLDTLQLVAQARALFTDSGGLQEEAAVLRTPVLLLRNETEWRYLVDAGVQKLIGNSFESITAGARQWLDPDALARLRAIEPPTVAGAALRAAAAIDEYLAAEGP